MNASNSGDGGEIVSDLQQCSNQAPAARGRKARVLLALDLLPLLELCEGIVVHLRSVRESKPTRIKHTKDQITLLDACRA